MDGLDGAVAIVTGGASGIGEACVRLLQRAGATVHVVDLAADPPMDVTDRNALDSLAARLDRLDALVNAAGILTESKPVDELPVEDFRQNFEINGLGTLQACQAFGPLLRERGGAVVNVASQAALVFAPVSGRLHGQQGSRRRPHAFTRDRLGRVRSESECGCTRVHRNPDGGRIL